MRMYEVNSAIADIVVHIYSIVGKSVYHNRL